MPGANTQIPETRVQNMVFSLVGYLNLQNKCKNNGQTKLRQPHELQDCFLNIFEAFTLIQKNRFRSS